MNIQRFALASATLALVVGCSTNSTSVKSPHSTNAPRSYVGIQFTNMSVHPSVARVASGGTVGWINYGDYVGAVTFPADIVQQFSCTELRPTFTMAASGLQSLPIDQSGDEGVNLPCPLKPGTYDYEVWLSTAEGSLLSPYRKLKAQIVVDPPAVK